MGFWAWFAITFFLVAMSSVLTYALTRLRALRTTAQLRDELAKALAALEAEQRNSEQTLRAAEETARRKALDDFLGDMRVEERRYVREHRLLFAHRKSLVLQERIFFRNIPLSNWVEHEVPVEEGADVDAVAKTLSVFKALEEEPKNPFRLRRFLM